MALHKCPECAGSVSTNAMTCPHCGNTKFKVPTGNTLKGKCPGCGGSGVTFPDWASSYSNCHKCKTTGQIDLIESKNLLDGSLSYLQQEPTVYNSEVFTGQPKGPAAPAKCPGCGCELFFMRSEFDQDGNAQHVYRCAQPERHDRPFEAWTCPRPCTTDVFRLSPDGQLVRARF